MLLAAVVAILGAGKGAAQADSVQHRNDCRLAEQVIATGEPRPHAAWAASVIRTCEAEAFTRAITAGLQRLRSSSDTSALRDVWGHALLYVNSQAAFDVGLGIAADRNASQSARVFALMGVLRMLHPNEVIDVATLTRSERVGTHYRPSWCMGGVTAGIRQRIIGAPVDAGARSRMRQVGRTILSEANNPAAVRAAAYCASVL